MPTKSKHFICFLFFVFFTSGQTRYGRICANRIVRFIITLFSLSDLAQRSSIRIHRRMRLTVNLSNATLHMDCQITTLAANPKVCSCNNAPKMKVQDMTKWRRRKNDFFFFIYLAMRLRCRNLAGQHKRAAAPEPNVYLILAAEPAFCLCEHAGFDFRYRCQRKGQQRTS